MYSAVVGSAASLEAASELAASEEAAAEEATEEEAAVEDAEEPQAEMCIRDRDSKVVKNGKTIACYFADEISECDWSSDVCSSDLVDLNTKKFQRSIFHMKLKNIAIVAAAAAPVSYTHLHVVVALDGVLQSRSSNSELNSFLSGLAGQQAVDQAAADVYKRQCQQPVLQQQQRSQCS